MDWITIDNLDEHLRGLEIEPFIARSALVSYAGFSSTKTMHRAVEYVPVANIIAANFLTHWGDIKDHRRTNAYIVAMIQALKSGTLDLEKKPPILEEYAGAYYVSVDGRTRCALAKLLGLKRIPAEVTHLSHPVTCHALTKRDYKILLERHEAGLWQGSLAVYQTRLLRRFRFAHGVVTDYEGAWVFAREMEKAKHIYQTIGARGKA